MIVPRVSCGGIEKPLRLSRRRAPATGVSTVNCRVSKPAAAARRDELVRDLAVAHDVQLEPVAPVRVRRLHVLDRRRAERRQGERDAGGTGRARPGDLALGLHEPGEAGRRDAERQGRRSAEDLGRRVDVAARTQDVGVELDVLERLAGARRATARPRPRRRCSRRRPSACGASRSCAGRAIVSAASRRRLRPSSSGFLNFMSSRSSAGLGSCRWTIVVFSVSRSARARPASA